MGEYTNYIAGAIGVLLGMVVICVSVGLWAFVRIMRRMESTDERFWKHSVLQKDPGYGRIRAMHQRKEAEAGSENRGTLNSVLNQVFGKKEQRKREQDRAGRDTRPLKERLRAGAKVTTMTPADMPPASEETDSGSDPDTSR